MKPRILIVDEDDTITQQLYWTLSDDYDVVTANDMQSAVRRATVYQPNVSILDLHLPPDTASPEIGLRVVEYIRAHVPESKILVMAASGIEKERACTEVRADGFIDKPFDIEKLLSTMRRIAPCLLEVV